MDEQNQTPMIPEPAPQPEPTAEPSIEQPQPTTTTPKHRTFMAVVAYILFFVPLLTEDAKDDPFVKFHVKQGLMLFIAFIIAAVFMRLPIIGWLLTLPLNILLFVLWLIGILNALGGKQKELPLIGKYAKEFQF